MTDKEFKRLKRSELIEVIYALQLEQQKLIEENNALKKQLDEQKINIQNAGSIAEATLVLNDVFAVAQRTADKYVQEVQSAQSFSREQSEILLSKAKKRAADILCEAKLESQQIRDEAEAEVQMKWELFQKRVIAVLKSHVALQTFLIDEGKGL